MPSDAVRGLTDSSGGLEGHVSRDCTSETKPKSCYKCGQEGHIVRPLAHRDFRNPNAIINSRATALTPLVVEIQEAGAHLVEEAEAARALSATAAARPGTLLVPAPTTLAEAVVVAAEGDTLKATEEASEGTRKLGPSIFVLVLTLRPTNSC